ncbi:hypothetical protein EJV47_06790 [Hymenobacter gummosus]|uniref:Uncharacterized protein n=1 Tax=Hymenobacter gummosus TaxID=1776032 RepID=A0A3S0K6W8_9BACT|nr:hypothetical protein [Hymenobacter gummosus]RTQ51502.1 hypothetical protein EJV47_06790 [Hymenobacter gummosus]
MLRFVTGLLLVLLPQLLFAQGWERLPDYEFGPGGRQQVARIIWREDADKPSPGFARLRDSSSTDELLRLSRRRNQAWQLYAALALADRNYPRLYEVFGRLIRRDHPVRQSSFSHGTERIYFLHASEEVWNRYAGRRFEVAKMQRADSLQFVGQLHRMDSVALQLALQGHHVHGSLLEDCLEHNAGYAGTYSIVRALYLKPSQHRKHPEALAAALAAYRRPEDVALLGQEKEYTLLAAAAEFPHPAFRPVVEGYRFSDNSHNVLAAVAAYADARAARLLDSLLTTATGIYHESTRSNLLHVLSKHYTPVFDSLNCRLWLEHHLIEPEFIRYFARQNPRLATAVFSQGLLRFTKQDYWPGYQERWQLLPMLQAIQHTDTAAYRRVCLHGIQVFETEPLEALCDQLPGNAASWSTPALLARLQEEDHAVRLFPLAKVLLSFNQGGLSQRVVQTLAQKPARAFPGAWRSTFNTLLQAQGLPRLPDAPQ